MTKRKENIKKIAIFGSLILISIIGILYQNYLRELPQDYTVGYIEKIYKPARGNTLPGLRLSASDPKT